MTCLCSTSCHSATLRMAASCVSRKIRSWFLQSPREKDWRNVTGAFPIGSQDTRGSDTVLFISARWAPSIRRPVLCTCLCHDTCPPDPKLWLNAVILCEVFLETSSLHALPPFPQPSTPFPIDMKSPLPSWFSTTQRVLRVYVVKSSACAPALTAMRLCAWLCPSVGVQRLEAENLAGKWPVRF